MALSQGARVGGGRRRLPFPEVRRSHRGAAHHVGAQLTGTAMGQNAKKKQVYVVYMIYIYIDNVDGVYNI